MSGIVRECACKTVKHQHGTYLAYNIDKCRCPECTEANRRTNYKHRIRRAQAFWAGSPIRMVDACGTRRRLQALAAVGHSTIAIAAELGVTQQAVCELRTYPGRLHSVTADKVAAVYDRMWNRPPIGNVTYVLNHARRNGWASPLCWNDEEIDDPNATPILGTYQPPAARGRTANIAEQYAELLDLGYSIGQIADRYGVKVSSVQTALARKRVAA